MKSSFLYRLEEHFANDLQKLWPSKIRKVVSREWVKEAAGAVSSEEHVSWVDAPPLPDGYHVGLRTGRIDSVEVQDGRLICHVTIVPTVYHDTLDQDIDSSLARLLRYEAERYRPERHYVIDAVIAIDATRHKELLSARPRWESKWHRVPSYGDDTSLEALMGKALVRYVLSVDD